MAVYLGATQLDGGGGAGGSSFPNTASFTSTQLWSVPQSLQDAISANGSVQVATLIVGGGGASNGGEVIYEIRTLTSSHYHDSNNNTILIAIGAGGSVGGETAIAPQLGSTSDYVITITSPKNGGLGTNSSVGWDINGTNYFADTLSDVYTKSSNGNPYIVQIRGSRYNGSYSSYYFTHSFSNGIPVATTNSTTNAAGASMSAVISTNQVVYSGSGSWRYDGGLYITVRKSSLDFNNETSPTGLIASGGNSGTNSISNRASTEGYYGGYGASITSTVNNTGQRQRSGLVKIFYF